jgi:D-glycero-D-manno-heptose 1,7-bisphosphate phosphatase
VLDRITAIIYPNQDGAPSTVEYIQRYLQGRGVGQIDIVASLEDLAHYHLPAACSHFLLLPDHLCCDPLALITLDQDLFLVQCCSTADGGGWCDQYLPCGVWFGKTKSFSKITFSNSQEFFTSYPLGTFALSNDQDVEKFLSLKPALFLDRDGVVIEDVGYPYQQNDLKLRDAIIPVIKWANQNNWWVVILTNQSGLARGIFSDQHYLDFTQMMERELASCGVRIDASYFSPYHPDGTIEKYAYHSHTRKPEVGMLLQALEQLPIDLTRSVMVGDKISDQLKIPLLKTFLIKGGYPLDDAYQGTVVVESEQDILSFLASGDR